MVTTGCFLCTTCRAGWVRLSPSFPKTCVHPARGTGASCEARAGRWRPNARHLSCMNCTTSSSLSMTRRVGGFRLDTSTRRLSPGRCWPAPVACMRRFTICPQGITIDAVWAKMRSSSRGSACRRPASATSGRPCSSSAPAASQPDSEVVGIWRVPGHTGGSMRVVSRAGYIQRLCRGHTCQVVVDGHGV